jgi:hypothetical protein
VKICVHLWLYVHPWPGFGLDCRHCLGKFSKACQILNPMAAAMAMQSRKNETVGEYQFPRTDPFM